MENLLAYKVLLDNTASALNTQISEHLAKGWLPTGSPHGFGGQGYIPYILQAMYFPKQEVTCEQA